MRTPRRIALGTIAGAAAVVMTAGPGLAHECTNLDKNPGAGAQIAFGPTGIEYLTKGLRDRVNQGVGPDGEIPLQAQWNGSVSHGVINVETASTTCAPA